MPVMWRRVKLQLRQARAVYHLLVPRQLANGVIPWRTPILTLAVWLPIVTVIPLLAGAPPGDVASSPRTLAFVVTLIWLGRVRHWLLAYFVSWIAGGLSGVPFLWSDDNSNLFVFLRTLVGAVVGAYVFAAMSRWDAPRLRAPALPFPASSVAAPARGDDRQGQSFP
jgi:hypothetical protein